MAPPRPKQNKVPTEPGFQKRLGEMYKKVLPAPPKHVPDKRTKANKDKIDCQDHCWVGRPLADDEERGPCQ